MKHKLVAEEPRKMEKTLVWFVQTGYRDMLDSLIFMAELAGEDASDYKARRARLEK